MGFVDDHIPQPIVTNLDDAILDNQVREGTESSSDFRCATSLQPPGKVAMKF